jgi:hypothetical protein
MADPDKDFSSIKALDGAAQKDALPLGGLILLAMAATIAGFFILGQIINSMT